MSALLLKKEDELLNSKPNAGHEPMPEAGAQRTL
jgi:hypothetical protein